MIRRVLTILLGLSCLPIGFAPVALALHAEQAHHDCGDHETIPISSDTCPICHQIAAAAARVSTEPPVILVTPFVDVGEAIVTHPVPRSTERPTSRSARGPPLSA